MGTIDRHTLIKTIVECLIGLPEGDDIVNDIFWRCLLDEKVRYKIRDDFHLIGRDPLFPLPELAKNSYLGFVNFNPDPDGVCRRGHLYSINNDSVYPSLPVAALAMSEGKTFKDLLPSLPVIVDKDQGDEGHRFARQDAGSA